MLKFSTFKISIVVLIGVINILLLTIFMLHNIYCNMIVKTPINIYILYTAPFIILWLMSVIFLFIKSWNCHGILYLIAGMFFAFLGNSDVGSAVFIFLSLSCFNKNSEAHKKIIYPIVLSTFFLVVFLKFAVFTIPLNNIIAISFFYSGAYITNYLINKPEGGNDGDKRIL